MGRPRCRPIRAAFGFVPIAIASGLMIVGAHAVVRVANSYVGARRCRAGHGVSAGSGSPLRVAGPWSKRYQLSTLTVGIPPIVKRHEARVAPKSRRPGHSPVSMATQEGTTIELEKLSFAEALRRLPLLWMLGAAATLISTGIAAGSALHKLGISESHASQPGPASPPPTIVDNKVLVEVEMFLGAKGPFVTDSLLPMAGAVEAPTSPRRAVVELTASEASLVEVNRAISAAVADPNDAERDRLLEAAISRVEAQMDVTDARGDLLKLRSYAWGLRGQGRDLSSPNVEFLRNAQRDVEAALAIKPNDAWSRFQFGWLIMECTGDAERSRTQYDLALALAPTFAKAFFNRAAVRYELRDYSGAADDYGEAFRMSPSNSDLAIEAIKGRANAFGSLNDRDGVTFCEALLAFLNEAR